MEFPYSDHEVDAPQRSTFPSFTRTPNTVLPPLLSNGSTFFQAGDFYPPPGLPMTSFNIDTASPSQLIWSPPPEPTDTQVHCETASSASSLSLPILSPDSVPSSPSTTMTLIDYVPESQTDDELRVRLDKHMQSEQWFKDDEPEPTVGAPGVPEWVARLAPYGRSIYECFVKTAREKGSIVYKCSEPGCKFKSPRLRRVVGHQRKKRNHKPFVCKTHPKCTFRGHTKDNITDHCSPRNATKNCEKCGEPIVKKNMRRHMKDVHSRR